MPSDIQYPTSEIRPRTSEIRHPTFDYPGCQRLFMRSFRFRSSLKSDPREKLRRSCLRPSAEHVSACGNETKLPVAREKKTSSIQVNIQHPRFDIRHPTSYIPDLKRIRVRCTFPNEGAHRGDKHSQKCKMIKILKKPE